MLTLYMENLSRTCLSDKCITRSYICLVIKVRLTFDNFFDKESYFHVTH